MSSATWKKIADACLVEEGYRRSTDGPVVKALLTDDAATFRGIAEEHGLCWVHEGRLFKCLTPAIALFAEEREKFLDGYWDYYRQLRAFRSAPCPDKAKQLSAQFDKVFSMETTYITLSWASALRSAGQRRTSCFWCSLIQSCRCTTTRRSWLHGTVCASATSACRRIQSKALPPGTRSNRLWPRLGNLASVLWTTSRIDCEECTRFRAWRT